MDTNIETLVLAAFLALKVGEHIFERTLSRINRMYYSQPAKQQEAMKVLSISEDDMKKTVAYSGDKFWFGEVSELFSTVVSLGFLALGGFGWAESESKSYVTQWLGEGDHQLHFGVAFLVLLSLLSMLVDLPFSWYRTFVIEQKHGYNRQTLGIFLSDRLKGLLLGGIIGIPLMYGILAIMGNAGENWWLYAWAALSGFSVLTAWLFPTFLAPLFNKFTPLPDGELKDKIMALAQRIGFRASGLSVMDGSKRSAHGNAYFTGMFGAKKIVLFDTLVHTLNVKETVAVLAHELGHFKLHHIRWGIIRSILSTGITFYLLSLCLPMDVFYRAFALEGVSNHGALVVFSMWFGLLGVFTTPIATWISRKNEFAADQFAVREVQNAQDLGSALLKLREKSQVMPITHPWFSAMYYSHPPIMERLQAMGYKNVSTIET